LTAVANEEAALVDLLAAIDDRKLGQVMRALESYGQRPMLEPALAAMRPRLRRLRPERPLTLERLLTVPFELALVADDSPHGSFVVRRGRLRHWQATVLDRLEPEIVRAATQGIAGIAAHDRIAILAAGQRLWPEAAAVLTTIDQPDEPATVALERRRVADCLTIGAMLVPLVNQLLPLPPVLDAADTTTLRQLIELGADGPSDLLGTLLSAVLRVAPRPWVTAHLLLELAPSAVRGRLRPLLEELLEEHRECLGQLVSRHAEAQDVPLDRLAADLARLAEALTVSEDTGRSCTLDLGDTSDLRHAAAALAAERCAAALETVIASLPMPGSPERAAAVRAREVTARRTASLVQAARRLASETPPDRLVEAAVERLVDSDAGGIGGSRRPVSVDDARLIEILVGPDIAWRHLRPKRNAERCARS
jgi:hypothetical protein